MITALIAGATYLSIGSIFGALIASKGVTKDGYVYDDSAITAAFAIWLLWPLFVFAKGGSRLLKVMGMVVNKLSKSS